MEKYRNHFNISKFIHNDYNELVVSDTFRTFALSMISLFVPIFLFQQGYSVRTIIIFELVLLIFTFLFHVFVAMRLINFIGLKKTLVLSYIAYIIFTVLLYDAKEFIFFGNVSFLIILGFFDVVATSFFWSAYHFYVVKTTGMKHEGEKVGILRCVPVIFSIAAPFIGGLMIASFGFKSMFLFATIMISFGGIILCFSSDIKVKTKIVFSEIIKKEHMKRNIIYFIEGVNYVACGFFWPFLLFLVSIKLMVIGFLYLLSNALFAIINFFSGEMFDKYGTKKMTLFGSIGHGFSLIFRALSKTVFWMTGFQFVGGLFAAMWSTAIQCMFYKTSHKRVTCSILNREFYLHIGKVLMCIFALVLTYFVSNITVFIIALIVSGVVTFFVSFFIEEKIRDI